MKFGALRKKAASVPGGCTTSGTATRPTSSTPGVPVGTVSARLGHSSPVITLSVYNHVLPSSDKAAVEARAEALR